MLIRNNFFNDFFGDMFDDPFFNRGYAPQTQLMKTDIREKDGQYLLEIGHPGKTGHRFVDQMHMVKRVVYYFPKGIRDQKSQENKRGKQHDNSCPPFPLVSGKLLKFVQL